MTKVRPIKKCLLKTCANQVIRPTTTIINMLMQDGDDFKLALVNPL